LSRTRRCRVGRADSNPSEFCEYPGTLLKGVVALQGALVHPFCELTGNFIGLSLIPRALDLAPVGIADRAYPDHF
jgi:hypothetical protein